MQYVRAHKGTVGNERADSLAKLGVKLRFELKVEQGPKDWFKHALEEYWANRKPS